MAARPLFDDPGSSIPDCATLTVDIEALPDVANTLRKEINGNLLPHIGPLNSAYGMGVKFGQLSHSNNMKQARRAYHDCLIKASTVLASRVAAADPLASAIDEIARRYGETDAMAKAHADDIAEVIRDAMAASPVPDLMPAIEAFSRRPGSFE